MLDTCRAIVAEYEHLIHCPSTEAEWRTIATRFGERWNFHRTLGAIDGKHVRIRKPNKSGSQYYNYKGYFSIILLAIVDADYRFIYVQSGAPGRCADSGLFKECDLFMALNQGKYCTLL